MKRLREQGERVQELGGREHLPVFEVGGHVLLGTGTGPYA